MRLEQLAPHARVNEPHNPRTMHRYWLPLPEEWEPVIGGATALTQAMVSRGEPFDLRGAVAAIHPSTQPSPHGEGAIGDENPSV